MLILETKALTKVYGTGETAVHALDGVDFSVNRGEFTAIVGTSGSGKSTLLHMLGGLDRPTKGEVLVDGKNIFSLKDEALTISAAEKSVLFFKVTIWYRSLMFTKILYFPSSWTGANRTNNILTRLLKHWELKVNCKTCPTICPVGSSSG